MSHADAAAEARGEDMDSAGLDGVLASPTSRKEEASPGAMRGMGMDATNSKVGRTRRSDLRPASAASKPSILGSTQLNGCLTLLSDGQAMLKVLPSTKTYRLEARPLLLSENANRLIHVNGRFGSVVAVEDPRIPGFVVDTVDRLAPNCSVKMTPAMLRKALP